MRLRHGAALTLAACVLAMMTLPAAGQARTTRPALPTSESVLSPPRVMATDGADGLYGVSCLSRTSTWASGTDGPAAVVEHWDGRQWARSETLRLPRRYSGFSAISAEGDTDVWAVGGWLQARTNQMGTLAAHWDGTAWTRVRVPAPVGGYGSQLNSVMAHSLTDAWAVGTHVDAEQRDSAFVVHWNGIAWRQVPLPRLNGEASLTGVTMSSPTEVWAVGQVTVNHGSDVRTLALRWNGTSWYRVATPNPDPTSSYFFGVASLADGRVWAVGSTAVRHKVAPLIETYEDGHWVWMRLPASENFEQLAGVSAHTDSDVWAVGTGEGRRTNASVTLHWDGQTWTHVDSPNPHQFDILYATSARGAGATWAVGTDSGTNDDHALSMAWNGHDWMLR